MNINIDKNIIDRELKALKNKNISDSIEKRIEKLLEEDIYKLLDEEDYC